MSNRNHSDDLIQLPLFGVVIINLTQGFQATIDVIDADLIAFKWRALGKKYPYASRRIPSNPHTEQLLHCVIMERILGRKLELKEEVDHKDGNCLNDRRENLRVASHLQNIRNTKRRSDNSTGYKGVTHHTKRWRANIKFDGKAIHLGYFDTPELAFAAYCEAARKYFGEFARIE